MGIFPEYRTTRQLIGQRDRVRVVRIFLGDRDPLVGTAIQVGAEFDIQVCYLAKSYNGLCGMRFAETLTNAVLLHELGECFGRTTHGVDHFLRDECKTTPWFLVRLMRDWEHGKPEYECEHKLEHDLCGAEADEWATRKWRAHLAKYGQ